MASFDNKLFTIQKNLESEYKSIYKNQIQKVKNEVLLLEKK